MPTTVTESGPFERLVNLHITEDEITAGKAAAARRLSTSMKLKGFRPGRAPTPVVEAAVGRERLRQETIEDLVGPTLNRVLTEEDIRPAVNPTLEDIDDVEGGVDVSVRVTLWPTIEPPKYKDRKIEVESPEVSDEELDSQIERMLGQFATVEEVDRPAAEGDFVSIDISAEKDGEEVAEAAASDLLYEVGSGLLLEGIDEHLVGVSAGARFSFDGSLPEGFGERAGEEVTYSVLVHEVKERILPEFDNEWVEENTEYETTEELVADLRARLEVAKLRAVANQFAELALTTLRDQIEVELPEPLIRAEMDNHLHRFIHRLEENELTLDDYFHASGISRDAFVEDIRNQAELSLKNQLVLEAVAGAEGIEVTDEDVSAVVDAYAARSGDPARYLQAFQESGQGLALAGDILRNRAMDAILASATPVDENGEPVDLRQAIEQTIESEEVDVVEGEIVEAGSVDPVVEGQVVVGEVVGDETVEGEQLIGEAEEEE